MPVRWWSCASGAARSGPPTPPDVLPAFVAEMDVMLAEPIQRTLIAAIVRGDTGYAHDGYRAMNDREAIKVLIAV